MNSDSKLVVVGSETSPKISQKDSSTTDTFTVVEAIPRMVCVAERVEMD